MQRTPPATKRTAGRYHQADSPASAMLRKRLIQLNSVQTPRARTDQWRNWVGLTSSISQP